MVLVGMVMGGGIESGGALRNYFILSAVIAVMSLPVIIMTALSNVIIDGSCMKHRNVLGFDSKSIDLSQLVYVNTYRTFNREIATILELKDSQGGHMRVRIKTWRLITIPYFRNLDILIDIIKNYANKSGVTVNKEAARLFNLT